jgi:hypothetical protein
MKNKYVAAVVGLLIATAATLMGMVVAKTIVLPQGVTVACGVVLGVGAYLGLYSPGARNTALALLVVVCTGALLLGSSCATMSATEKAQLIDCGEKGAAAAAMQLAPQVGSIIGGQSPNWNADIGDLLVSAGPAALCALDVVISQLETTGNLPTADIGGAGAGGVPKTVSPVVALARANAVKARLNYRVK